MSQFLKPGRLGGLKPTPDGEYETDCTHVLLTMEEYGVLLKEISDGKAEIEAVKNEADTLVQKARAYAQKVEAESLERIDSMQDTLEEAKKEVEYHRQLNENLLRVAKERANVDRNLRPKKTHTGYIVLSSSEKEYRFKRSGEWKMDTLWETVMQSPYTVEFTLEQVCEQMQEDLFRKHKDWLIGKIGISECYDGTYEKMMSDWKLKDSFVEYNILLNGHLRFRANFRDGYWEFVFMHTKPLKVIPAEMSLLAEYQPRLLY